MSQYIVAHRYGGPEVLTVADRPLPVPGPGQLRIAVRVAGVNFPDLRMRSGAIAMPLPFAPGFEVAGVVDAVGPGVAGVAPGHRVVAMLPAAGGYAEHVVVETAAAVAIPDAVADDAALAAYLRGVTALLLLRVGARVQPGEQVYVPAAAGGVGSFVVQLAQRIGARVIAGASSEAKRALARELGAAHAVDSAAPDLVDQLRAASGGRGVDVVLALDAGAVAPGLDALAPLGRLVLFGADAAVAPPALSAAQVGALLRGGASVGGFAVMQTAAEVRAAAFEELLGLLARGDLRAVVEARWPLAEAAAAHRAVEARETVGNAVLVA